MSPSATPTRAERLRSAGRSGPSRYRLVAGSAVLGLIVSLLCAVWTPPASAVATVAMVLVIAWGWPAASGVAEGRGGDAVPAHTGIIGASGLAACAVVLLTASASLVTLLPAVVAVGVLACFIAELVRGEGAPARLESVISSVTGVLAAVSSAGWIAMALVHEQTRAGWAVWVCGAVIAVLIAGVGIRLIAAGPADGPRRGAVTLGLVPVAFFGILGCAGTFLLLRVVAW